MIRIAAAAIAIGLAGAPLQCGSHSKDPDLRTDDSPGDALWALAMDFRAKGNEESTQATLQFLVEKYPSNRHATDAKTELSKPRSK